MICSLVYFEVIALARKADFIMQKLNFWGTYTLEYCIQVIIQSSSSSSSKSPSGSAPAPTSIALRRSLCNTRWKRFEKGKRAPSISLHLSKKNLRHQDALRAASKVSSTEAQKNTGSATSRQITRLQEQGIFCLPLTLCQFLINCVIFHIKLQFVAAANR